MISTSWVSFCISTFQRPQLLADQLKRLLDQTFPYFDIVVSDNDPQSSAKAVCDSFNDDRIKYFHNVENIGMIKSFNKSIERAKTEYIVMVTDDDPIEINFLNFFYNIYKQHSSCSIYCGFKRNKKQEFQIELIEAKNFIAEIIDPVKTPEMLWSSSIMKKEDVVKVGGIPDYGSPHLADHAFIALVGNVNGAVVVNKMFSSLTSHNTNFSKSHFESYISGCKGFHLLLTTIKTTNQDKISNAVSKHLKFWFISCVFNLKKFYTISKPDSVLIKQINEFAVSILQLSFMKHLKLRYYAKEIIFQIKNKIGLLR